MKIQIHYTSITHEIHIFAQKTCHICATGFWEDIQRVICIQRIERFVSIAESSERIDGTDGSLRHYWDSLSLEQMKVIPFIKQPSVIRRILSHLHLWEDLRPSTEPLEMVCESFADYVPWQDDMPAIEVG